MPYTIFFAKKKVLINPNTQAILTAFEEAYKEAELPTSPVLGEEKLKEGLKFKIFNLYESVFNTTLETKERLLPELKDVRLYPYAEQIYGEYVNYLNTITKKCGCTSRQTEAKELSSPYVVMRELLLRLAALALSTDMCGDRDGEKLVKVIEGFIVQVLKGNALIIQRISTTELSKMQIDLNSHVHNRWIKTFNVTVKAIKTLTVMNDLITHWLDLLKQRRHQINRYIISLLDPQKKRDDLSENWIDNTLLEIEKNFIDKANDIQRTQKQLILTNDNKALIIPLAYEVCKEKRYTYLTYTDTNDPGIKGWLQILYSLLQKTSILENLLSNLENIHSVLGWFPIAMGIINYHVLNNILDLYNKEYEKICNDVFEPVKSSFGSTIGQDSAAAAIILDKTELCSEKNFITSFNELQDSSHLEKICSFTINQFTQLNDIQPELEKVFGGKHLIINTNRIPGKKFQLPNFKQPKPLLEGPYQRDYDETPLIVKVNYPRETGYDILETKVTGLSLPREFEEPMQLNNKICQNIRVISSPNKYGSGNTEISFNEGKKDASAKPDGSKGGLFVVQLAPQKCGYQLVFQGTYDLYRNNINSEEGKEFKKNLQQHSQEVDNVVIIAVTKHVVFDNSLIDFLKQKGAARCEFLKNLANETDRWSGSIFTYQFNAMGYILMYRILSGHNKKLAEEIGGEVKVDYKPEPNLSAMEWYELSKIHRSGELSGFPKDNQRAFVCCYRAAAQDHRDAKNDLTRLYGWETGIEPINEKDEKQIENNVEENSKIQLISSSSDSTASSSASLSFTNPSSVSSSSRTLPDVPQTSSNSCSLFSSSSISTISSSVTTDFTSQQKFRTYDILVGTELEMPGDDSCLFWCVALGVLIPVLEDEKRYRSAFNQLFVLDEKEAKDDTLFDRHSDGLKNRIQAFINSKDTTLISKEIDGDPFGDLINLYFRQKVASYIHSHSIEFSKFIVDPPDVNQYVTNLRSKSFWGGEIEIRAIYNLLGEQYRLVIENSTIKLGSTEKPTIYIIHTNAIGKKDGEKNHYNLRMPNIVLESTNILNNSSSSSSQSNFVV